MATVFITGGSKNTGYEIAKKFAENGYNVAISGRCQEETDNAAKYICEKYGVLSKGYTLELSDVSQIKYVFSKVKEDFGTIDTFVANAANLGINTDFLSADENEYNSVVDANLKGAFFCAQQAGHIMKENGGGSIVFVSSVHTHQCLFGRSLYTASKGGD